MEKYQFDGEFNLLGILIGVCIGLITNKLVFGIMLGIVIGIMLDWLGNLLLLWRDHKNQ